MELADVAWLSPRITTKSADSWTTVLSSKTAKAMAKEILRRAQ